MRCCASLVASHTATALVGKQRLENDTTKGAPGRSARRTSPKSRTGWSTYWIDTAHIAASNVAFSNGRRGSRLTSWTTCAASCGLSAISSAFRPSPTTSWARSLGRWLRQLLMRSSSRPRGGRISA